MFRAIYVLFFTLLACTPGESRQVAGQKPVPDDRREFLSSRACYEGRDTNGICFSTVNKSKLPEPDQDPLYDYADPATDPAFPPSFDRAQYRPPIALLDLRDISPSTWLSENFMRQELMRQNPLRGFYGMFSPAALHRIERMRAAAGKPVEIHSGYRSPGYNRQLDGAAKWSRHTYGDAVDLHIPGLSLTQTAELCEKSDASFVQVYESHVHCDWRGLPLTEAFFGSSPTANRHHKSAVTASVTLASRIQLNHLRDQIVLSTSVPQEDSGFLLHEWQITLPSGGQVSSQSATVQLKAEPGTYDVRVRVGHSILMQEQIHIPTSSQ